jgi:integrase
LNQYAKWCQSFDLQPTTSEAVEQYILHLFERRATPSVINTFRAALNYWCEINNHQSLLSKLAQREINAAKKLINHQPKKQWLSSQEFITLCNSIHASATFKIMFILSFYQLLRIADLLNLKTQDFDFTKEQLTIVYSKRQDLPRQIPLNKTVVRFVQPFVSRVNGPLFNNFSQALCNQELRRVCTAHGLRHDYTWHVFRHSGATYYAKNGVPFDRIKQIGRWLSTSSCQGYIHLD